MRGSIFLLALLVSIGVQAQPAAQEHLKAVQADPAATKSAIEAGKQAAFFCANCHGDNGVSKTVDVPNLAGQNPAYLLEQIRKFGTGERKNEFMQGMIKVLKDDERVQVALYYASLGVPPSPANPALVAKGKALFEKICVRCHGEQARGSELFPRLAGQKAPYLQLSIKRYRDNSGVRTNQLMTIATSQLSNDDILAVANYLTQMP